MPRLTQKEKQLPRQRFSYETRRKQLVDLGLSILASTPPEAVPIDQIADAAGISRGLLFHYFKSKKGFQVAVVSEAAQMLVDEISTDPNLPPIERIRQGICKYVEFVGRDPGRYQSLVRGASSADPDLQAVYQNVRSSIADRIYDILGIPDRDKLLDCWIFGWIAMVEESTLSFFEKKLQSKDKLINSLLHSAICVLRFYYATNETSSLTIPEKVKELVSSV